MQLTVSTSGDTARVTITGHVDERGAEALKHKLKELNLTGLREVAFDFQDVQRIGSAGIGQLLLFYKNLSVAGGGMRLENVSPTLHELFKGLKLDTLFKINTL